MRHPVVLFKSHDFIIVAVGSCVVHYAPELSMVLISASARTCAAPVADQTQDPCVIGNCSLACGVPERITYPLLGFVRFLLLHTLQPANERSSGFAYFEQSFSASVKVPGSFFVHSAQQFPKSVD